MRSSASCPTRRTASRTSRREWFTPSKSDETDLTDQADTTARMKYPEVRNYIGGGFATANLPAIDVFDPSAGNVISRVPMSGVRELDAAVAAAKKAFPAWSAMPIKQRVQVFFKYKALLEKHIDELAALVTEENGKIA